MIKNEVNLGLDALTGQSMSRIQLRIEMRCAPASVTELAEVLSAQGHQVEMLDMKNGGERIFGVIGRLRVDGVECIAKISGAHLPEDHPDYLESFIRQGAIEQEYEGLKAAVGYAPQLVGHIVAGEQTVGVLRQFVDGMPLREAVKTGLIEPEQALLKAIQLTQAINNRGYRLWDCESSNLWFRSDGEVILIEGACLTPHTDEERNSPGQQEKQRRFVAAMLGTVLPN